MSQEHNGTSTVPLIPRRILFGNPVNANPQISPDGTRLAYLAPHNEVLNVWIAELDADDKPTAATVLTGDTNRGIRQYFWGKDGQHILYVQDIDGNENWHLYATHLQSHETRDLTPFENVQVRLIAQSKRFPNEILVGLNQENPQIHDVYHLDLTTGELKLDTKNPGTIVDWIADADYKVRAAMAVTPSGGSELLVRENVQEEWKQLLSWESEDLHSSQAFGFTLDGQSLFLEDSRDFNTGRLIKLNLASGEKTVLAEDPQYDMTTVIVNPDTYEIQAAAFTRDHLEWEVLDQTIKLDFDMIREIHRGDFLLASRNNADTRWVVAFTVDNGPVPFYLYNRETRSASFLFVNQPELANYTLAVSEPISFTSRDGLEVHGYLTRPVGTEQGNLPMVLNVHGGPWVRDNWGYNPEAQWLANRGYACLQINYRGSSGYGKQFLNAGNKEWGRNMHNDLIDGVEWAVKQGIADPKRIAIYGGSYGGYAALVGATFTPDVFCCAVDIVGPSNLITLIKAFPPYWANFLADFYQRVGNPETEEEFLLSRSPISKVDQLKIPMLIAQGANDPRVNRAESEQFVEALKKQGLDYEYMLFPDEGHGFAKPENRLKFYTTAERFLERHLGGRHEA